MNTVISIVIVNWNGEHLLKKCISSIFQQTYKKFEIIVVDNNSTDNSISLLQSNFPEVIIVMNPLNIGYGGGNNVGINKAKGDLILVLNNDMWMETNFLSNLIHFYDLNNYDVVAPIEGTYEGKKRLPYSSTIDILGHPIFINSKKRIPFYLTGGCLFFKKDFYLDTGGFDKDFFMYFEDIDWFWRLNLLNKRFSYANELYIFHLESGTMGKGIKYNTFLWRNQNTLQMLLKNYSTTMLLFVIPLYLIQNFFEMFFFLFYKPSIAATYIKGIFFNIYLFKNTLKKRNIIQKSRISREWEILKKMYFGSAKLHHLFQFLK